MGAATTSLSQILKGENAFYKRADYEETTRKELASSKALKHTAYRRDTEHKVWRVVKAILSVVIFPLGLWRILHALAGKLAILPSSSPQLLGYQADHAYQSRQCIHYKGAWKVKRISVVVDGYTIDACLMGTAKTLGNGRWVLASNGNGEYYEDRLKDHSFKQILAEVEGNALVFNYPGVGASSGMPNRSAMAKAYRAMLRLLEDEKKGIGAKEIIGYGHSIGGGVQGDALNSHRLAKGIKYVFVKSRTFSSLAATAASLTNQPLGLFVRALGWNISSMRSSKRLKAPEIIMQTASVDSYSDIAHQPQLVKHDGIISKETSLAYRLLASKHRPLENKYFMGMPEEHNDGIFDTSHLTGKIKEMLA